MSIDNDKEVTRNLDLVNMSLLNYLDEMAKSYFYLKDYGRFTYYLSIAQELYAEVNNSKKSNLLEILKERSKHKKILEDFVLDHETFKYKSKRLDSLLEANPWLELTHALDGRFPFLDLDDLKARYQKLTNKEASEATIYNQLKNETFALQVSITDLQVLTPERYHYFVTTKEDQKDPLGLFLLNSSFAGGRVDLEKIYQEFKDSSIKHLFVADCYQSSNSFLGLDRDRFLRRKKLIDRLEIEHQIKTFQGSIIDLDLEGRPLIDQDLLNGLDFVIIDLKTRPNQDVVERLEKAVELLPKQKNKTIINVLDAFSFMLDLDRLERLILKENLILQVPSDRFSDPDLFIEMIQSFDHDRIRFAICGTNIKHKPIRSYLEGSFKKKSIVNDFKMCTHKITPLLNRANILNYQSRPFNLVQSKNIQTIREGVVVESLESEKQSSYLKRLKKLSSLLTSDEK